MSDAENGGWKFGEDGEWVITPDQVTISQHMIRSTIEFVDRHTGAMPPMLVHEMRKHLRAQSQMVALIAKADAILSLDSPAQVTGEWVGANIVDRARDLVVSVLRDAARQYAPVANGKGSYEHLAGMAAKVERAEAVHVDSYLVLDCVIAAIASTPTANAPVSDVGSEQRARELLNEAHAQEMHYSASELHWPESIVLRAIQAALPPHSDIEGLREALEACRDALEKSLRDSGLIPAHSSALALADAALGEGK